MNTRQIDYCIELSRTLNFRKAANNVGISQPTFSYQIKLLEDELGFIIFERTGKGAILTQSGVHFISYISKMREDLYSTIEQCQKINCKQ